MEEYTPLPKKKMIPICILIFCEMFNGNSIFSYVSYMVLDLVPGLQVEDAGYYAGLIASCWFLAQFVSSFFWGRMSDVIGRKPVLLIGVVGSLLSSLAFGFSFNFPFAIFARSVNGLLNGNLGVVKTYIAEITNSSNQARAFGLIGLMSGLGAISGSMIGGFTAQPYNNLSFLFCSDGIWGRFPYLLPNIIAAMFSLAGFLATVFFLHENEVGYETIEMEDTSSPSLSFKTKSSSSNVNGESSHVTLDDVDSEVVQLDEQRNIEEDQESLISDSERSLEEQQEDPSPSNSPSLSPTSKRKKKAGRGVAILRDREIVMTCSMYALLGFASTMFDEVWPLWVIAPVTPYGGLGFTLTDIGIANAIGGVSISLFNCLRIIV